MMPGLERSMDNKANSRAFGLLRAQGGFTLVEALVLTLVIVILVVSVYIGVVYAEKQLLVNYRDRVATLLVAGELEMEYYRSSRRRPFELQQAREYVLDDIGKSETLKGRMTIELKHGEESSNEQVIKYQILEATFRWMDTTTKKERYIRMREDYFAI